MRILTKLHFSYTFVKNMPGVLFISIIALGMISGCIRAETVTEKEIFYLNVNYADSDSINVFCNIYNRFIPYEQKDGVFKVIAPALRGGFSSFLGLKYNETDPLDSDIYKIYAGDVELKSLSYNEIHKLDREMKDSIWVFSLIVE